MEGLALIGVVVGQVKALGNLPHVLCPASTGLVGDSSRRTVASLSVRSSGVACIAGSARNENLQESARLRHVLNQHAQDGVGGKEHEGSSLEGVLSKITQYLE